MGSQSRTWLSNENNKITSGIWSFYTQGNLWDEIWCLVPSYGVLSWFEKKKSIKDALGMPITQRATIRIAGWAPFVKPYRLFAIWSECVIVENMWISCICVPVQLLSVFRLLPTCDSWTTRISCSFISGAVPGLQLVTWLLQGAEYVGNHIVIHLKERIQIFIFKIFSFSFEFYIHVSAQTCLAYRWGYLLWNGHFFEENILLERQRTERFVGCWFCYFILELSSFH